MNPPSLPLIAQAAANETLPGLLSILNGFPPDKQFVLVIVFLLAAVGVLITVVCVVASTIGTIHRRNNEMRMKQDMLDRGMTAEEIATVVEATPPTDFLDRWAKK